MRWLLVCLCIAMLAACGGDGGESAGEAMERMLETYGQGQWGRHWDDLHPAHQAIVSRDQYIACRQGDSRGASIETVEVVETYAETLELPRIGSADATAITVRLTSGSQSQTATVHAVEVDGKWRWIMSEDLIVECSA